MTINHLPATGYVAMPWKNGTGSTDEILLLPRGASRDAFDLRISRATISAAGVFSAFPGVERTITLIEGEGLSLEFDSHAAELSFARPYCFDSGLTPVGVPKSGPVRVLNVMAARSAWSLASADVIVNDTLLKPGSEGLIAVFALRGSSGLSDGPQTVALVQGDSALVDGPTRFTPDAGSAILAVPLHRATSG